MAAIRSRKTKAGTRFDVQVRREGYPPQNKGGFQTRKEAEAWGRDVESQLDRGVVVSVAKLRDDTVLGLIERFRDEELPHRKGRRWEGVRIKFWTETEPWVRHRLDQDLAAALRLWVGRRRKVVSAATVNREMNLLSSIFTTAIKEWSVPLPANPVHLVRRPKVDSKPVGQVWTVEDLDALRQAHARAGACPEPRQLRVIDHVVPAVELSIETAMRRGELCSVLAEDVFLDRRFLVLRDTKNGSERQVPLSTRALEILAPLVEAALKLEDHRVLPVNADSLGVEYRKLRAAAGIEDKGLRMHDGRHTATSLASKKLPILELAAFTGHRDLRSLKRYYHADATEIAKKLG